MGLFRNRTPAEDRTLTAGSLPPVMLTSSPADVTPTSAMTLADVYACVRVLSDAAASVPLIAYRRRDQGRERAGGRIADLLDRPAPATTQANLIGQCVAHLNLHGNAYLGLYRDADGRITQLGLLAPDRVVPELAAGVPRYKVTDVQGRQSWHGVEDVLHIRALSTDGLLGLSPVRQCRLQLGLSRSLTETASYFFENSARPSGILKVDGHSGQEQVERIKAAWEQRHQGSKKSGGIAVLAGAVDFTAVSMPLDDAQFLEQRKLSSAEICRLFRIPPWMLGAEDGGSMTYSNVEQQQLAFVTHSLRPWLVLIEQAISAHPDLCPGRGLYVEFLLDSLLRGDSATRAGIYEKALNPVTGWMRREEVRRLENLDPEPQPARALEESLIA